MNEIILLKTIEFLLKSSNYLRRPHPTAYETICCRQPMGLARRSQETIMEWMYSAPLFITSLCVSTAAVRDYENFTHGEVTKITLEPVPDIP
ncbi:hypothetical protein NPIL_181831 [Nephila pilipes]|uniref:Uncharacterized protein n=1 Tax=Nephila pilipes TaxID=299642 RepID=A0A8X6PG13_NEPPI|nr:hypothetical protein NPIL_181831 [Nephila pilipes]